MTSWLVAGGLTTAAISTLRWLRPLHPAQLWAFAWAAAALLYALRLVPYRELGVAAALLISLGSAAFIGGACVGGRGAKARLPRDSTQRVELAASSRRWAATLLLQLGPGARNVEPKETLEEARRLAEQIAEPYRA